MLKTMEKKNQDKHKTYAIIFALLVLLTFVSLNNKETPSGEFVLDTFEETLIVSCLEPISDLVDDLAFITNCEGSREIALGQQFLAGNFVYKVEFQFTAEETANFNALYNQFCTDGSQREIDMTGYVM